MRAAYSCMGSPQSALNAKAFVIYRTGGNSSSFFGSMELRFDVQYRCRAGTFLPLSNTGSHCPWETALRHSAIQKYGKIPRSSNFIKVRYVRLPQEGLPIQDSPYGFLLIQYRFLVAVQCRQDANNPLNI
jgi:hypothetical protein